jgi:D-alanyl-D-alanine dipeptidase
VIADIPVYDNAEPLVDLATLGIACPGRPATCTEGRLVRLGLAKRLVAADAALPTGIRLLVMEGYRDAESQRRLFASHTRRLRATHQHLSPAEIRWMASRYVAPPEVAPHVAGAAVDITLIDMRGRKLEMGAPDGATPSEIRAAGAFDSTMISARARTNRDLLAEALGSAGLINYPTEWWHWSYGDRYWAFVTGASAACYGAVAGYATEAA